MSNITPVGKRALLTSRGTVNEAGGIHLLDGSLRDSNVCTTEDGETVIARDMKGYFLPDRQRIVEHQDVMAKIIDGEVKPIGEYVLVRKCIDPEDELIVTSLSKNKSKFAEILAAGPDTVLEPYIGWLAYVDDSKDLLQKVEDSAADWLIDQQTIEMIVKTED